MTTIYGIKNCDTMKKAFAWLDENKIAYEFHDYKKQPPDEKILNAAIKKHGWENVINQRGTTWRALPENEKSDMNETKALTIALQNPSIIKRPLLAHNNQIYLGFKDSEYSKIFSI